MDVAVQGIGERLRERRKEKKLTQRQLADRVGIGSDVVSKHERGEIGVSAETLFAYARALDTTAEYLAGNTESRRASLSPVRSVPSSSSRSDGGIPKPLAALLNDGRCNPLTDEEMAHMGRYLDEPNSTELDDLEIHLLAYRAERDRTKKAVEAFQRAIDRSVKAPKKMPAETTSTHQLAPTKRKPVTQ